MTARRVVITGIGAITPIGVGRDGLWDGLLAGRSAVRRMTRFDPSPFRSHLAAEIDGFDPLDHMEARTARRIDRFSQFGVAAAGMAVIDAGPGWRPDDPSMAGVSIGSALGGLAFAEEQHETFMQAGPRGVSAMLATAVYGGASGANVAIELGLRGPNLANASSCASGAMAIGEAARVIRAGEADVMLTGGVETPLAPLTFGAFSVIRAMSSRNDAPAEACRPFDAERDGFVMAEGAAVMVLEERDAALRRGARVYGELAGYGQSNDGYHMTAPRPDGSEAARAICLAVRQANISVREIGYVNAHATGTVLGDAAEACALRRALGPHGGCVPVSGTKGLHGHALGATGAIEAAITLLALRAGYLPGTANLVQADDDCRLNLLPPEGRWEVIEYALSTSFGFGGANAALLFRRVDH